MLDKSISTPALNWVAPIKRSRKNRSVEEKRNIVLESLSSTASIAAVARTHDINPNLLHTWRWQYRRGELGEKRSDSTLIPVRVSMQPPTAVKETKNSSHSIEGRIEIMIGEARVLIHGAVQSDVIETVLKALAR